MKKRIGIMGSSQIEHIIPLLQDKYDVVNIQTVLDNNSKFKRRLSFLRKLLQIDILYDVYVEKSFWRKNKIAHLFGKKVVCHWIGSDAREADEGLVDVKKLDSVDCHLTCFEPLSDQLRRKGIESKIIPIIPYKVDFSICNMPNEHCVLIYMPEGKEIEYGYEEIFPVIQEFQNIKFYIVANSDKTMFKGLKNVKLWGWVNHEKMEEIYDDISIVLRIHKNDGLSMSVVEALAKGKKIIWNCDYDFCYPGKTTSEITQSLKEILSNPKPEIDNKAHDFIITEYSKKNILKMYEEIFDRL